MLPLPLPPSPDTALAPGWSSGCAAMLALVRLTSDTLAAPAAAVRALESVYQPSALKKFSCLMQTLAPLLPYAVLLVPNQNC